MKIVYKKRIHVKTKNGVFEVFLQKWGGEKGYTVLVPDLPEIVTEGDNVQEAKTMAKEAIEFCFTCRENEYRSDIKIKRGSQITVRVGV